MNAMNDKSDKTISRRRALQAAAATGAGLWVAGTATGASAATDPVATDSGKPRIAMRFKDPAWNLEAKVRLEADTAPNKFVYGWGSGVVHGVRDGEKVRPLLRFEVFSAIRVLPQPDGSWQRLCRELVFYRDLATNKLLDEWDNPYSGERVRVVDIANDPYNYKLSEFFPDPPSYGGLNTEKAPRRPFILNWNQVSDDVVTLESDIHLYYPSALKPEKWPRESPGAMTRVSELFRYFIRREDLENPALTHVPYNGIWSRVTPWLPWMLMDQGPGHAMYLGNMQSRPNLDRYPADTLQRVRERYPTYLTAPEAWGGPSLSSLERYALEQQPAPPRVKK